MFEGGYVEAQEDVKLEVEMQMTNEDYNSIMDFAEAEEKAPMLTADEKKLLTYLHEVRDGQDEARELHIKRMSTGFFDRK